MIPVKLSHYKFLAMCQKKAVVKYVLITFPTTMVIKIFKPYRCDVPENINAAGLKWSSVEIHFKIVNLTVAMNSLCMSKYGEVCNLISLNNDDISNNCQLNNNPMIVNLTVAMK